MLERMRLSLLERALTFIGHEKANFLKNCINLKDVLNFETTVMPTDRSVTAD